MIFTIYRDFRAFVHEGGWNKLLTNDVDHAPLHRYEDDGSSIYEPNTQAGQSSISSFNMSRENLDNRQWVEESVSDIARSIDFDEVPKKKLRRNSL